jgi:AraC-like DNA-binding protein
MMELLLSQKIDLFTELLSCEQNLYFWEYTPSMQLIKSTCPEADMLHDLFCMGDSYSPFLEYIHSAKPIKKPTPLIISNTLGLSWIASFELSARQICRIYLAGPVFNSDVAYRSLEQELYKKALPTEMIQRFTQVLRKLPIILLKPWLQYGLMLHKVITGENIEVSDFNYQTGNKPSPWQEEEKNSSRPRRSTWLAEQTAMQMIEDGCLNYKQSFGHLSSSVSFVSPQNDKNPSRTLTNSVISFITLATRAAIRGGLDVETAYFMGNYYIQEAENCNNLSELMQVNVTMYDDFVQRVHKLKQADSISSAVHSCCNYIELHLGEKLSLKTISSDTGYDEYYLARKFKKEIGITVSQYIKKQRVERAKILLRSTTKSILEIGDELGFANSSHFADAFRSLTDMAPSEFREKKL